MMQAIAIGVKSTINKWTRQADVLKLMYTLFCAFIFIEIFEDFVLSAQIDVSSYGLFFIILFGVFGFIAFAFKQRFYVFTSFITCAAIASFIQQESRNAMLFESQNDKLEISMLYLDNLNHDNENDLINCISQKSPDVFGVASVNLNQNSNFQSYIKESEYCMLQNPEKKGVIYSKIQIKVGEFDLHFMSDYILEENIEQSEVLLGEFNSGKTSDTQNQKNLNLLSEKINSQPLSKVIFGDFGMVFWDKKIRDFRKKTKLQNARHDISGSETTIHIFYSDDLICTGFEDLIFGNKNKAIFATFQFQSEIDPGSELSMLLFSGQ
jgi:hypothetical protein